MKYFMRRLEVLLYYPTVENVLFNKFFVIPESCDWETTNPGIRNCQKQPGIAISALDNLKHALPLC